MHFTRMALMILLEAEDQDGNKAKIQVKEFHTLAEAIKEIKKLKQEIENLKKQLNGTDN